MTLKNYKKTLSSGFSTKPNPYSSGQILLTGRKTFLFFFTFQIFLIYPLPQNPPYPPPSLLSCKEKWLQIVPYLIKALYAA